MLDGLQLYLHRHQQKLINLYSPYFVGGGSGFVGKYLRSLAEKQGYEVVNISRKPKISKDLSWVSVMLMSQRSI